MLSELKVAVSSITFKCKSLVRENYILKRKSFATILVTFQFQINNK